VGIFGKEKVGRTIGVYLHIPYCVSKCPYCDFKSVVSKELPEKRYVGAALAELSTALSADGGELASRPLESLYIGGGTPSLFSARTIDLFARSVRSLFAPFKDTEITIEVNPDTAGLKSLEGYFESGVNRLSIGFQSLSDAELKALGRTHSADKAIKSFASARAAGFANIGVDLIYGAPAQSVKSFTASLEKVIGLAPEHISLYSLTLEEGTPFHRSYVKELDPLAPLLPPEEEELEMYGVAVEMLAAAGYSHYEVSNWALPGYRSVHNSRYWSGADYLGLGSSAHSFLSSTGWGLRRWNESDPERYMRLIEDRGEAVSGTETLTRDEALTEALLLGLRQLDKGVVAGPFKARFGLGPTEAYPAWKSLETEGLVLRRGDDLLLTPSGVLLLNEVVMRLKG